MKPLKDSSMLATTVWGVFGCRVLNNKGIEVDEWIGKKVVVVSGGEKQDQKTAREGKTLNQQKVAQPHVLIVAMSKFACQGIL